MTKLDSTQCILAPLEFSKARLWTPTSFYEWNIVLDINAIFMFINTFINPKSIAFVETFSTMQLLQFFIFLSFLASVSAFYGKVPGQQRMFEEYYKNDQPRGDYNWIPHFGMRENYKFMTTFKPDVSNVLYSKMNSFLLIIYFFAANGQPRVTHFLWKLCV